MLKLGMADRFKRAFSKIAGQTGFGGVAQTVATEKDAVAVKTVEETTRVRYRFRHNRKRNYAQHRAVRNAMAKESRRRNR